MRDTCLQVPEWLLSHLLRRICCWLLWIQMVRLHAPPQQVLMTYVSEKQSSCTHSRHSL